MQIKTITCHEVYNHGASLQEYALLTFLNANGFEAQTIHYKPDYLSAHFKLDALSNPKFDFPIVKQLYLLAKLPNRLKGLKRKKAFDVFASKYIPTDTTKYTTNEELKNNLPSADAYICGSDQIWNSFFENGKDPAFYLDFVPEDKLKISYAASFATDTIAADLKPFVTEKVKRIDYISVRETSALEILKDLGITNATQVLDPVFLLDQYHWLQFVLPIQEDFVFIYDFDSNPTLKKMVLDYKVKNNVKIYTVNQNIDYADKNFYFEGPETFLSLMYHAKFVFTNSFHSVAYSLIFQKQFAVFDRNEKINTRMRDLLGLFHIKNLVTGVEDLQNEISIDYKMISNEMIEKIQLSKNFIIDSITNGK